MRRILQQRLFALPLLVSILALAFVACGASSGADVAAGGGGGVDAVSSPSDVPASADDVPAPGPEDAGAGDPGGVDVPAVNSVTFVPGSGASEAGALWVSAEEGDTEDELRVHLWAGGFPDVLGWAFDLRYHPGALSLVDVELHDVLTERTWEGRCVARERGDGRLNVGCARFLVGGDDILGVADYSGPLEGPKEFATLRFAIEGAGTFDLSFDEARRAARSGEEPALPIAWRGGTVTITRALEGGTR